MAQHDLFLGKQLNDMVNRMDTQISDNNANFTDLLGKQNSLIAKLDENITAINNNGELYVGVSDTQKYLDDVHYSIAVVGTGTLERTLFNYKVACQGGIRIKAETRAIRNDGQPSGAELRHIVEKNGIEVFTVSVTNDSNWYWREFDIRVEKGDLLTIKSYSPTAADALMEVRNWQICYDVSTNMTGVKTP